jgi:hypothetical protein
MLIGEGNDFTVTFTLDGYAPQTLPVHATMSPGGWTEGPSPVLNPGSLFPTLESLRPPPAGARRAKTASRPAAAGGRARNNRALWCGGASPPQAGNSRCVQSRPILRKSACPRSTLPKVHPPPAPACGERGEERDGAPAPG